MTAQLTPRQMEIVTLLATGATNKEIAARMCITEQTVKNHLVNVFDKARVRTRVQLLLWVQWHLKRCCKCDAVLLEPQCEGDVTNQSLGEGGGHAPTLD